MAKVKKAEAVKALDDQIVIAKADAEKILSEKGSSSDEYRKAMQNLKELCEARAAVADSNPKKQSNGVAAACIAGVFGLGQTFLLLIHDDDHCIPKWFKSGLDGIKMFLRGKD